MHYVNQNIAKRQCSCKRRADQNGYVDNDTITLWKRFSHEDKNGFNGKMRNLENMGNWIRSSKARKCCLGCLLLY